MPTITHTLLRADGTPIVGAGALVTTSPQRVWDGDGRLVQPVTATSDAAGVVTFDLPATADLEPAGSSYIIHAGGETLTFAVPAQGGTIHDNLTEPDTEIDASAFAQHIANHGQTELTAHNTDATAHAAAIAAHAATPHGGVKAHSVDLNTGDLIITNAGWQAVGPDITIPAAAGDLVMIAPAILSNGGDAEMDAATIVAGTPRRYRSSGTTTQKPNGFGGWYAAGVFDETAPPTAMTVDAGDIVAGNATFRILAKATSATPRTFKASAVDYAGSILVINLGQPAT